MASIQMSVKSSGMDDIQGPYDLRALMNNDEPHVRPVHKSGLI